MGVLTKELIDVVHTANWALRRIAKEIPGDDPRLEYGTWDLLTEALGKTEKMLDRLIEIDWREE